MQVGVPKPKKKGKKSTALGRLSTVTIGDVGELLSEGASKLRRFLNVETKRFDQALGFTANTVAGLVTPLSPIAEGADYNARDGRSIKAIAHELRLTAKLDPAKALFDLVRVVVFADMENPGATPAVLDVLQSAAVDGMFNADNLKRFLIYHDEVLTLDTYNGESAVRVIKLALDHHIRFRGTTGAAASMAEGNLFVMWIGLSAVASTSFTAVNSRVSFVDN